MNYKRPSRTYFGALSCHLSRNSQEQAIIDNVGHMISNQDQLQRDDDKK
jgi:hypothetical protein